MKTEKNDYENNPNVVNYTYEDSNNTKFEQIELQDLTDEDFEIIETADWTSIYEELNSSEIAINDKLTTLSQEIENSISQEHICDLANECKNVVIDSILGPFGLSRAVFEDKDGGAVTTQHNADQGIFANDAEQFKRQHYNFDKRQRDQIINERKQDGNSTDQLTGKKTDKPNVDHYKSAKKYHEEGGWQQDEKKRHDFGTDERNLNVVDESLNKSMGAKDKHEYEQQTSRQNPGTTNKEDRGMDNRRVNAAQRRSDKAVEDHAPTPKERALYYGEHLGKESLKGGLTLAMRQALGCALKIMVEEGFHIIKDAIKKYKDGVLKGFRAFIIYVIEGVKNIRFKIIDHLKKIGSEALNGGIAGVISTLITFVINTFITTIKRVVTIIREAILSLTKAVRTMCDTSLPLNERMIAAGKIVIGAVTTCIGVFLTESIAKFIAAHIPFLCSISDDIANVLVAIIVGLISILVTYLFIQYKNNKIREQEFQDKSMKYSEIMALSNELMDISARKVEIQLESTWTLFNNYLVYAQQLRQEQEGLKFQEVLIDRQIEENSASIDQQQCAINDKLLNLKRKLSND